MNPMPNVDADPMDAAVFSRMFNVSRETYDRLARYLELLSSWNAQINLVSKTTIPDAWTRHLADSVQLLDFAPPNARTWIDLGSGAGLPGLPVAIVAAERAPELRVTLVESDRRKTAFLMRVKLDLALSVLIESRRIEALPAQPYDVISARALAPLERLCTLAFRFKHPDTVFLFPKGARLDSELTAATRRWHIRGDRVPSRTRSDSAIFRITDLEPRQ